MEGTGTADRTTAGGGFLEALEAVAGFLSGTGRPGAIIGGVAVIAHGFARTTVDIDASLVGEPADVGQLLAAAKRHGIVPRIEGAEVFARENLVLLLEHRPTRTPVDISLALQPFEIEALEAASVAKVAGVRIRVPSLTDLVVYKLLAGRQQDLRDVEVLLSTGKSIDNQRIEEKLAEFDAILETDRLGEFRQLIERRRPAR